jgi:hypothetical protein
MVGVVCHVESAIFLGRIPQKQIFEIFCKCLYLDGRLIWVLVIPMKWTCHPYKMRLVAALLTDTPNVN